MASSQGADLLGFKIFCMSLVAKLKRQRLFRDYVWPNSMTSEMRNILLEIVEH